MLKEFKEFILKGNMLDLAVGIVIGAAFGSVVDSFVNDILMPPIGLLLGKVDFSNLFVSLSGERYASLREAQAAGAATLNYGIFLKALISFTIIGFAVFLVVKLANKLRRAEASAAPEQKECPYCFTSIAVKATRCPNCTSQLGS